MTIAVIACGGSVSSGEARDVSGTCKRGQYVLRMTWSSDRAATAAIVRIRPVGHIVCRLRGTLRVEILHADSENAVALDGNPARVRLDARLTLAGVVREFLWQNWCGDPGKFVLGGILGRLHAETALSPPGCDDAASPSTLAALAGWGQPQPFLGAAPVRCGPLPPRSEAPGTGPMFGSDPFWFGPYAGYDETRRAIRIRADAPHTRNGWQIKTLWLVSQHANATVNVRVGGLAQDAQMSVRLSGRYLLQRSFVLDPAHPGAFHDPATADFPSYVYFSRAGCYFVEASWPSGMTRVILGVGR